jgi:multiple sugar transport system substrate-binding protein
MLKRSVIALLLLVLVFSVALIGEAKTTVKVISWWDFTNSEPLKQLKAKFEELNPDLELEFMQIGSGYADKVLVMIAGGADLPDVMMLAMDKVPVFASKNAIMNLDGFINKDEEFKKELNNLYPVVKNSLQYNGSFYAMPRDVTSKVMFINKKMFEEAGVDIPDADWNWDVFAEIAKKLSRDTDGDGNNDQWGFYFPKYMDGFTHWLMQNGGGLLTRDSKSLLGKPESIEALKFLRGLITAGYVPSDTQAKQYGSSSSAPFIAGKVAMVEGGLSTTVSLKNNDVDYVIRPLPRGKKQLSTAFVNAWAIPRGAKNPELSWRVLKFFASKEAQQIVLNTGMGLPANKEVDVKNFLADRPDNKYFIESLEYSEPFPTHVHGVDFYKLVQNELDLMWLGKETVEEAVKDVEEQADKVLSGRW